ncbi:MAG: ATP-binding cassette domain-containing protein, partial [Bacillota bacterium]
MSDRPILTAADLTKVFLVGAGVRAVDGISLRVYAEEFLLITGPSGCGKSTLLNLLGGLDRPTFGEVTLDGQPYSELNENGLALMRRTKVGFV